MKMSIVLIAGLLALFGAGDAAATGQRLQGKPKPSASASAVAVAGAISAQHQNQAASASVTQAPSSDARLAPGFSAPSLAASDEACMGSSSVGAGVTTGVVGVSATFGTTWESWNCNLRMFAQQLRLAGAPDAALHLLANHPEVRAALVAAGKMKPAPSAEPAAASAPSGDKHPACSASSWATKEWRAANC